MLEGIECLGHSTIKIHKNGIVIYIDPFKIKQEFHDADFIFITHSHYDHFSKEDILKVRKDTSKIIVTEDIDLENIQKTSVIPNNKYTIDGLDFETIPAYNLNKNFHPKENNWVGYIITIDNIRYYIAGDTDLTEENKKVKCDVAFVPVGGTYTMNAKEAATLVNSICPKIAIPIHYGSIVGTKKDAEEFCNLVNPSIKCNIMI